MNWAGLLPKLLKTICKKLSECIVCRSRKSAARSQPVQQLPVPKSLPLLQLSHDPSSSNFEFYSLSEDRTYKICLPEVRGSRIIGSVRGLLLMISSHPKEKLSIINPFTELRVDLPYIAPKTRSSYMIWAYSGSIVVGKYRDVDEGVFYCRIGDHCWTSIKALEYRHIKNLVYSAGNFVLLDVGALEIVVLDGETLDVTSRIILPLPHCDFYVDFLASSDDDTVVFANFFDWVDEREESGVFEFNSSRKKLTHSTCVYHELLPSYQSFVLDARRHPQLNKDLISKLNELNKACTWPFLPSDQYQDSSSRPFWIVPSFNTA